MNSSCPICIDSNLDFVSLFQCNHYVCLNCLPGCLFLEGFPIKCPLCRTEIMKILIIDFEETKTDNLLEIVFKEEENIRALKVVSSSLKIVMVFPNVSIEPFIKSFILTRNSDGHHVVDKVKECLSKCPLCDFSNTSVIILQKHIEEEHGMMTCPLCPQPLTGITPNYYSVFSQPGLEEHQIRDHMGLNFPYYFPDLDAFYWSSENSACPSWHNQVIEYIHKENQYLQDCNFNDSKVIVQPIPQIN